jgi:vacuolar-type H+-ATPase subunit H
MRDVIQKVIAAEAEANHLVLAARTEADRLVTEARLRAGDLVERARTEARVEFTKILAAAEERACREKTERLNLAANEIKKTICLDETQMQRAVDATLCCVRGFG